MAGRCSSTRIPWNDAMSSLAGEISEFSVALLVAAAAGLVGSFALMKRMSLASDVVSHLALPGIGIALVFHLNPVLGAASTLFVGTLLVWSIEKKTGIATEAVIGVVFAASLAVGALITPTEDLEEVLFGRMHALTWLECAVGSAAAVAVIGLVLARRQRLALALFSPDIAAATGVNIDRLNLEFLLLFSLTILLCLKFLGALLAGALLMIPAATGRKMARGLNSFLKYSTLSGVTAIIAGLFVSARLTAMGSTGPTIVLAAVAIFIAASLRRKDIV
jgi:ABC-type Mn2+/Zn2+ transport system permease subunit